MPYVQNQPPGTYDHRQLHCRGCKQERVHYREVNATGPMRCTVCERPDVAHVPEEKRDEDKPAWLPDGRPNGITTETFGYEVTKLQDELGCPKFESYDKRIELLREQLVLAKFGAAVSELLEELGCEPRDGQSLESRVAWIQEMCLRGKSHAVIERKLAAVQAAANVELEVGAQPRDAVDRSDALRAVLALRHEFAALQAKLRNYETTVATTSDIPRWANDLALKYGGKPGADGVAWFDEQLAELKRYREEMSTCDGCGQSWHDCLLSLSEQNEARRYCIVCVDRRSHNALERSRAELQRYREQCGKFGDNGQCGLLASSNKTIGDLCAQKAQVEGELLKCTEELKVARDVTLAPHWCFVRDDGVRVDEAYDPPPGAGRWTAQYDGLPRGYGHYVVGLPNSNPFELMNALDREVPLKAANPQQTHTRTAEPDPIPMILHCPECRARHVDGPTREPHRTHACQACGFLWAPAVVTTMGVQFLPGCRDGE